MTRQSLDRRTICFAPSWSPDGAFLTYQAFDGMDVEIYRVRVSGSAELNLTDNTVFDTFID